MIQQKAIRNPRKRKKRIIKKSYKILNNKTTSKTVLETFSFKQNHPNRSPQKFNKKYQVYWKIKIQRIKAIKMSILFISTCIPTWCWSDLASFNHIWQKSLSIKRTKHPNGLHNFLRRYYSNPISMILTNLRIWIKKKTHILVIQLFNRNFNKISFIENFRLKWTLLLKVNLFHQFLFRKSIS